MIANLRQFFVNQSVKAKKLRFLLFFSASCQRGRTICSNSVQFPRPPYIPNLRQQQPVDMWDQHNKLYYYTWPAPKNHFYEIDFLLSRGSKLCPAEVESSGYNTRTSLDELLCSTSVKRVTKSSL